MGANQQQNRDLSGIGIYTGIIRDIDLVGGFTDVVIFSANVQ